MEKKKTNKKKVKKEPKKKKVVLYNEEKLKTLSSLGMKYVDPKDIRPARMLLMQGSSNLDDFITLEGKRPRVGQFFLTAAQKIYTEFEAYFVFAAKGKYTDKRKPEEGEKKEYRALGFIAHDLTLFGMVFRSSSLYALSPLFSASASQNRPMFSYRIRIESKELSNDLGTWYVPVVRIVGPEYDEEILVKLENAGRRFEENKKITFDNDSDEVIYWYGADSC